MISIVFFILVILSLLLLVAFLVLLERNALRLLQIRKRANIVGFYRLVQTIIDRIKLVIKQYILKNTHRIFFFFFHLF